VKSTKDDWEKNTSTFCCCCTCLCRDKYTKNEDCCCCPVKVGVIWMSILVFVIGIALFFDALLYFFNHYYPFWFGTLYLIFLAPYLIALLFIFFWWGDDNVQNRKGLLASAYCAIGSIVLIILWIAVYLYGFNDDKDAHVGFGTRKDPSNYQTTTKMYTLMWYILSGFLIVLILFYWAFLV